VSSEFRSFLKVAAILCTSISQVAHAQRADENAVTDADDAFGTAIGLESTGIYTERNTRGFSPLDAGNVRNEGIYFDQVQVLAGRVRASTAIRVGFGAIDFPFVAPTGVVDHKFRPMPDKAGNSLTLTSYPYGGYIAEWDLRLPLVKDHISLTGGVANAQTPQVDGTESASWGVSLRPIFRFGGTEFSIYSAVGKYGRSDARPLVVVKDGFLPKLPPKGKYLGQTWARGRSDHQNHGVTLKSKITDRLSFRGGLFHSMGDRQEHYSEVYSIIRDTGLANHVVFADPAHDIHSTSGEGLVALQLGNERFVHRIFGGYRMRNRLTETGGSDTISVTATNGPAVFGETDTIARPEFDFLEPNSGRVRQSSWMLGYIGHLDDRFHVNVGIQKARYRASARDGENGDVDRSRANPWLYNATLMVDVLDDISVYVATQRGLEDSGLAPGNALNRDEQLPATKTTQYEGGIRWDFGKGAFVVSAFEITKPYFTFDNRLAVGGTAPFVQLGKRRHRGIEGSLTGHFGGRWDIVAGAVVMDPVVTGEARDLGLVGKRPAGTPDIFAQLDANYRTDLLDGLTVTGSLHYTGKRAVTASPIEDLGDKQLTLPGWLRVDLGLRHRFKLGYMDVSMRAVVQNLFDKKEWHVVSSDVVYAEDRRRFLGVLVVDF